MRVIGIIFFRADNYTVAKEILVNKYCTKVKLRASIGETQSSHCQRITPHPRRIDSKCFRCNVPKMQEDLLRKFYSCVCYL